MHPLSLLNIALCIICTLPPAWGQWTLHTIDNSSKGADGVRLADVNGDGLLDVATGWEEGNRIRAYINPGPARVKKPWPAVTVGEVQSPEDAVFADVDGDGAFDVLSCCEGRNRTIYIHWAPKEADRYLDATAWTTQAIPVTKQQQSWMFALPMELDGKPGMDFIVASKGEQASVGLLLSGDDPRATAQWTFTRLYDAGWIMSLEPVDLDGDGDLDVVVSDRKNGPQSGVLWLENPGRPMAKWHAHRAGGHGLEVMFLDVADIDGDQQVEILTVTRPNNLLILRKSKDIRSLWETERHDLSAHPIGTAKAIRVGDVDLDGRMDLFYSCEAAPRPKIGLFWLNYPELDFHDISGPIGLKYDHMQVLDLDADGDLDVICCEERDQLGVFWYENPARSSR
jgi:hypothetical protein